jgi:ACS family phthalate transporter-like MFS transporter
MNPPGATTAVTSALPGNVGQRAIRRIAYHLLPFVFLVYVVNYIDRVNVSFANLRMSADLGFSTASMVSASVCST